jgi:hypothetical protein
MPDIRHQINQRKGAVYQALAAIGDAHLPHFVCLGRAIAARTLPSRAMAGSSSF